MAFCTINKLLLGMLWICLAQGAFCFPTSKDERIENTLVLYGNNDVELEKGGFAKAKCHLAKMSIRKDSDEIARLNASNLLEILEKVPGVLVGRDQLGRPVLGLYGSSENQRVALFIDGIRQNDPFDGSVNLFLPAEIIDYVDVFFGPGGTWFGEGSLIGTIFVVTKKQDQQLFTARYGFLNSLGATMSVNKSTPLLRSGTALSFLTQSIDSKYFSHSGENYLFAQSRVDATVSRVARAKLTFHVKYFGEFANRDYQELSDLEGHNHFGSQLEMSLNLVKRNGFRKIIEVYSSFFFKDSGLAQKAEKNNERGWFFQDERVRSARVELGTRSHLKPFTRDDLFLSIGGALGGLIGNSYLQESIVDGTRQARTLSDVSKYRSAYQWPSAKHLLFDGFFGHVFARAQNEWQIKRPLALITGAQLVFPISQRRKFNPSFFPNIGLVYTPNQNWRLKLAYQSSWREPTVQEKMPTLFSLDSSKKLKNRAELLGEENAKSLESVLFFSENFNRSILTLSLAGHATKIENFANVRTNSNPNAHSHDLFLTGLRFFLNFRFGGGQEFFLGVLNNWNRTLAYNSAGTPTGATNIGGFIFPSADCEKNYLFPAASVFGGIFLDMYSLGDLYFSTRYFGAWFQSDEFSEHLGQIEISYRSKPIHRVFYLFTSYVGNHPFQIAQKKSPEWYSGLYKLGGSSIFCGLTMKI